MIYIGAICIDPFGDSHIITDYYYNPSPRTVFIGGNWNCRSYNDKYYPINMLNLRDPEGIPDRALAAMFDFRRENR